MELLVVLCDFVVLWLVICWWCFVFDCRLLCTCLRAGWLWVAVVCCDTLLLV